MVRRLVTYVLYVAAVLSWVFAAWGYFDLEGRLIDTEGFLVRAAQGDQFDSEALRKRIGLSDETDASTTTRTSCMFAQMKECGRSIFGDAQTQFDKADVQRWVENCFTRAQNACKSQPGATEAFDYAAYITRYRLLTELIQELDRNPESRGTLCRALTVWRESQCETLHTSMREWCEKDDSEKYCLARRGPDHMVADE